jgi:hypothetical protein
VVVPDQLEHMTVPQLKERLKARGLPVTGLKQVLIERLRVAGATSSGPAPAAIDDEPAHTDANVLAHAHAPIQAEADDLDAFFDDEVLPIHAQQPSSSSSTSRGGQRPQRDPSAPAADSQLQAGQPAHGWQALCLVQCHHQHAHSLLGDAQGQAQVRACAAAATAAAQRLRSSTSRSMHLNISHSDKRCLTTCRP